MTPIPMTINRRAAFAGLLVTGVAIVGWWGFNKLPNRPTPARSEISTPVRQEQSSIEALRNENRALAGRVANAEAKLNQICFRPYRKRHHQERRFVAVKCQTTQQAFNTRPAGR